MAGLENDDGGLVIDPDENAIAGAGTPEITPWNGRATVSLVPAGFDCGGE